MFLLSLICIALFFNCDLRNTKISVLGSEKRKNVGNIDPKKSYRSSSDVNHYL